MKISIQLIFTNYRTCLKWVSEIYWSPDLVALAGGAQNTRRDFWETAFSSQIRKIADLKKLVYKFTSGLRKKNKKNSDLKEGNEAKILKIRVLVRIIGIS